MILAATFFHHSHLTADLENLQGRPAKVVASRPLVALRSSMKQARGCFVIPVSGARRPRPPGTSLDSGGEAAADVINKIELRTVQGSHGRQS